jgi:hypothetical protein
MMIGYWLLKLVSWIIVTPIDAESAIRDDFISFQTITLQGNAVQCNDSSTKRKEERGKVKLCAKIHHFVHQNQRCCCASKLRVMMRGEGQPKGKKLYSSSPFLY